MNYYAYLLWRRSQYDLKNVGTPYYVAPQVLAGRYDQGCDVWSCGIIMYIMLCGYPPFYGETDSDVLARVRLGTFTFVQADWKNISTDATDLIIRMLKKSPTERYTAGQAVDHVLLRCVFLRTRDHGLVADIFHHSVEAV